MRMRFCGQSTQLKMNRAFWNADNNTLNTCLLRIRKIIYLYQNGHSYEADWSIWPTILIISSKQFCINSHKYLNHNQRNDRNMHDISHTV